MKAIVTWVLVADGAQAQVFEHGGPGKGLIPIKDLHFAQEPLKAQDINTDRPGRHSGAASARARASSKPIRFRSARSGSSGPSLPNSTCCGSRDASTG